MDKSDFYAIVSCLREIVPNIFFDYFQEYSIDDKNIKDFTEDIIIGLHDNFDYDFSEKEP